PDTALTDDDLANFNIVLVGSPGSNQLIEKFIEDLPFTVKKDFISIGSKTQQGKYLGFYFIYPNPINREKYIAVLGFNNPGYFSLSSERDSMEAFHDVSDFGWFDFKIWDNRDPMRTLSRSEEHTSELQSRENLVCRLLLEKKNIYMVCSQ